MARRAIPNVFSGAHRGLQPGPGGGHPHGTAPRGGETGAGLPPYPHRTRVTKMEYQQPPRGHLGSRSPCLLGPLGLGAQGKGSRQRLGTRGSRSGANSQPAFTRATGLHASRRRGQQPSGCRARPGNDLRRARQASGRWLCSRVASVGLRAGSRCLHSQD